MPAARVLDIADMLRAKDSVMSSLPLLLLVAVVAHAAPPTLVATVEDNNPPAALNDSSSTTTEVPVPKPEVYSFRVESHIQYRYAKTVISSRLANPAKKAQEVVFSAVLPETAFISGFNIETGGKVYEAYVKEKEEAKKEYNAAVASGFTAAHVAVSARDSNTFTISVNVEAGAKVTFNLTYEELLTRRLSAYNHVINLHPGQVVRDLQVDVYINENRNITTLRVPELSSGNEVEPDETAKANPLVTLDHVSPTSAHIHYAPTEAQQKKAGKEDGLSGQLIVQYDVDRDPQAGEVLVYEGYFVHFFAPKELPALRKHAIFVLDVSGSMEGRKISQLKDAMTTILGELQEGDYFNIIEFSYSVTVWNLDNANDSTVYSPYNMYDDSGRVPNPAATPAFPASPEYIAKAKDIISKMNAGGGTNIDDALKTAIEVAHKGLQNITVSGTRPEPIVVFLTDGEPTVGESRPSKIYASVSERNGHPSAAIFSLAFGNDADLPFLRRLSLRNAGFARKIYEAADAALQLKHFYKQIASPLLANVKFTYPKDQIEENSTTKILFPTLFRGSELVVAGKLAESGALTGASVEGEGSSGIAVFPELNFWRVNTTSPPESGKNAPSLERLWAYLTVQQLLEDIAVAGDTDNTNAYWPQPEVDEKKNGTAENNKTSETKKKALELALKYSFVTKLTSLVVVKPNETSLEGLQPGSSQPHAPQFLGNKLSFGTVPLSLGAAYAPVHPISASAPGFSGGAGAFGSPAVGFAGGAAPPALSGPPLYVQESALDFNEPISTTTKLGPSVQLVSLQDLTWLPNVSTSNDSISLPYNGNETKILKLDLSEENKPYQQCVGPEPFTVSHCRHLKHCSLNVFAADIEQYTLSTYFCQISEYAAVCCPDYLQPVANTSTPAGELPSSTP